MKKNLSVFLFGFFLIITLTSVCVSEQATAKSNDQEEITNGSIYDEIAFLIPEAKFYKSDSTLHIDISDAPVTGGVDLFALRIMKYTARILSCEEFSDNFNGLVVGCLNDDHFFMITITDFENIGNFYSSLTVRSTANDSLDGYLTTYYNDIFGHFDLDYQRQVIMYVLDKTAGNNPPKIETRNSDNFFMYSTLFEDISRYNISNGKMSLILDANYENDEESGYRFCNDIKRCIDTFSYTYKALSFDTVGIACVSRNTGETLCSLIISVSENNTIDANVLTFGGDSFKIGFIKRNDMDSFHSTVNESSGEESQTTEAENAKQLIEQSIRSRINSNYRKTTIDTITINDNPGTDTEGDYIVLVNLTWNVKNSAETTEEMLTMYSDDLAASLATDHPEVQELAVFWKVPYLTESTSKWAYEKRSDGMYLVDNIVGW